MMSAQITKSSEDRFNMSLMKTKMCKYFLMGKCSRGSDCKFAHGQQEVTAAPDLVRTRICPNASSCTKANCNFAHREAELRCQFFAKGICTYGEQCKFSHEDSGFKVEVIPELPVRKPRRRNRRAHKGKESPSDVASVSTDIDDQDSFGALSTVDTMTSNMASSSESECSATQQESICRLAEVEGWQNERIFQETCLYQPKVCWGDIEEDDDWQPLPAEVLEKYLGTKKICHDFSPVQSTKVLETDSVTLSEPQNTVRLVQKNTFLDLECEEHINKFRPRSNSI